MFQSLADSIDRRDRFGDARHIAELLPQVLAKYSTDVTQPYRVRLKPSPNAFPLLLEPCLGSPLLVGGGPFSSTFAQD